MIKMIRNLGLANSLNEAARFVANNPHLPKLRATLDATVGGPGAWDVVREVEKHLPGARHRVDEATGDLVVSTMLGSRPGGVIVEIRALAEQKVLG